MMLLKESLAVMLGGAFGCFSRFGLSRWIQSISHHTDYPWEIFVCNSSFSMDTITLLQQGDMIAALSNLFLTVFFCIIATAGGLLITRSLIIS